MIKPILAAAIAMAGTAAGGMVEEHMMDVKTVAAVGSVVWAGAWYVSRRFTRLEDRMENVEKSVSKIPCIGRLVFPSTPDECDQLRKEKEP